MSLILRKDIGRKLTIEELDGNFEWLSENSGSSTASFNGFVNDTIEIEIPLDPVGMITAVDYTQKLTRFITGTFTGFYSNTFSEPIVLGPSESFSIETKSYKGQFDYNFNQNGGYGYDPTSPLKTNFDYTIGIININGEEAISKHELSGIDTNIGGWGCFGTFYQAERQCYGCDQPIGQHTFNFKHGGVVSCGCGNYWFDVNDGGQINGDGCVTSCWGNMWCCGCCPPPPPIPV